MNAGLSALSNARQPCTAASLPPVIPFLFWRFINRIVGAGLGALPEATRINYRHLPFDFNR